MALVGEYDAGKNAFFRFSRSCEPRLFAFSLTCRRFLSKIKLEDKFFGIFSRLGENVMKKIIQICSILVLTTAFFVVSAQAQTETHSQINTTVTFDFKLGDKTYKAGAYVIKISSDSSNAMSLILENSNGKMLQTIPVTDTGETASGKSRVVFNLRDNQQHLAQIITKDKIFSVGPTTTASN
jgi:hypothetical protein